MRLKAQRPIPGHRASKLESWELTSGLSSPEPESLTTESSCPPNPHQAALLASHTISGRSSGRGGAPGTGPAPFPCTCFIHSLGRSGNTRCALVTGHMLGWVLGTEPNPALVPTFRLPRESQKQTPLTRAPTTCCFSLPNVTLAGAPRFPLGNYPSPFQGVGPDQAWPVSDSLLPSIILCLKWEKSKHH